MKAASSFDPTALGLPKEFILTDFTRLKGCSCKVPQPKLLQLLRYVASATDSDDGGLAPEATECAEGVCERHRGSVGMDCSIVRLGRRDASGAELLMVSTTDFFFPSVEDPYLQGAIGAANVLSDLYAAGVTNCDTMLMLLAASTDMDPETERYTVAAELMKGFVDKCREGGVRVTGGQTVLNPWPLIGGVATAVVTEAEMISPTLRLGDVLVLTKPLGHQLAVNLKQWTKRPSPLFRQCIEGKMTVAEIDLLYDRACANMARLNRSAAALMRIHGAHGATDVTGFGILGHATNFSEAADVARGEGEPLLQVIIDVLPVLRGALKADVLTAGKYKLRDGLSAETSGGLLVALPSAAVEGYMRDLATEAFGGHLSYLVGRVVERTASQPLAVLSPLLIEVREV